MTHHVYINNNAVEYKLTAVECKKLKRSSNQTRDRNSLSSITQIRQIAENLKPDRLGHSCELSVGAPVINTDCTIISGHGRIEAIIQSRLYSEYCKYWSLDDGFVMVRVIDHRYDSVEVVNEANNVGLTMNAFELSKLNSKRLKPTLNQFIAELPLLEQNQYITDGNINKSGVTAYENAIMYSVFGDCVADYINYNDFEYKNVIKVLVQVTKTLDSCNRKPLKQALQLFLMYKQEGYNPNQLDLLDKEPIDNYIINIFNVFVNNSRSAKKMLIELEDVLRIDSNLNLFEPHYSVRIGNSILYHKISESELLRKHGTIESKGLIKVCKVN